MPSHVPFVNSVDDCDLVHTVYADSPLVRVTLDRIDRLQPKLPPKMRIWLDASIDGFHREESKTPNQDWLKYIKPFSNHELLWDKAFLAKPKPDAKTEGFVNAVLDKCRSFKPLWISVPQLPLVSDSSRNNLNRALARATGKWHATSGPAHLVLPAILTDQDQCNLKTERNKKIELIKSCFESSSARAIWVVDQSLADQTASPTFRNKRFPGLIAFHAELQEAVGTEVRVVAGPYWGLHLVLWARGLCQNVAIGLGKAYQFHLAGGQPSQAKMRIAIPPLRRWAQTSAEFRKWLDDAITSVPAGSPAHTSFVELRAGYNALSHSAPIARKQIATFHKEWYNLIEAANPASRALTLYQDLSAAYVLGRTLPELPAAEKTARRPEKVAEYLMLSCL